MFGGKFRLDSMDSSCLNSTTRVNMSNLTKCCMNFSKWVPTPVTQSSYEDVMKATLSTINIFKNSTFEPNKSITVDSSENSVKDSCDEMMRTCSESSGDSILSNSLFDSEKNLVDIEFQKSIENIKAANEMYYDLKKILNKKEENSVVKFIKQVSGDIMDPLNLNNSIHRMKSALCHIQTIIEKRSKLKEVLRSNVLNDVWHIKKEHHKSVVNFFTLASELVKNIHTLIAALENSKELNNNEVKMLLKQEMEFHDLVHAYTSNLEELHSFLE